MFITVMYLKSLLEPMPTGKLKLAWHAQTTELLLKMHTRKNKNTFLCRHSQTAAKDTSNLARLVSKRRV